MQMRVGGRFSLTALVILASEFFSLVLSAVRSPKHCLHTIKATKRDLPCPVNAIMNQAASVRHKICSCSFCSLICVARHLWQPNAIVAQGIDSTLSPCTGQYVGGFSRYNQHMHGLQVFQVTQCQETGVFFERKHSGVGEIVGICGAEVCFGAAIQHLNESYVTHATDEETEIRKSFLE